MRILIAGASGAIGRALVRRLRANQHEAFALTQSRDSAAVLKEIGAEPVIADALDAAAVKAAVGEIRPDAVINELTSLPRHYTPAEMKAAAERDRKVRVEGNINLLAVLRDASVRRYLLQSSGFWYAPGPGLADESVPLISSASRESRPAPAPTGSWKRAHRRRRGWRGPRPLSKKFRAVLPQHAGCVTPWSTPPIKLISLRPGKHVVSCRGCVMRRWKPSPKSFKRSASWLRLMRSCAAS